MAKKIAFGGLLTALAMIFSYVESLIPLTPGIPGIKLGLANLVVLTGLYRLRAGEVLLISVTRILLTGFLFGSGASILYSLAGGLVSFLCMELALRSGLFSPVGVSVFGGVSHNIGQLLIACWIVKTAGLLGYLPVLLFAGTLAGAAMGVLAVRILQIFKYF